MYALNLLSVLAALTITFHCELGWANSNLIPGPDVTEAECNARRLLRFRQLWNLYWIRNEFLLKSQAEQAALREIMGRTREPLINLKSFDETTQRLLADGGELRARLQLEIRMGSRDAGAAQKNLNYLNDKLTKRVSDCRAFSGGRRAWAREFDHVGMNSVGIIIPPSDNERRSAEKTAAPAEAVAAAAPQPQTQPAIAPIPVIIVPDTNEAAVSQ